jgi:hypothetical protein
MRHDDDLDDFSHLPTVDADPSHDELKELWKKQNHRQAIPEPEHSNVEEVLEQELLEHHLPEEVTFVPDYHASHAPEWAEETYSEEAEPMDEVSVTEKSDPADAPEWIREAFGGEVPEPAPTSSSGGGTKLIQSDLPVSPASSYVDLSGIARKVDREPGKIPPVKIQPPLASSRPTPPPVESTLLAEEEDSAREALSNENRGEDLEAISEPKRAVPTPVPGPQESPIDEVTGPDVKTRFRATMEKIGGRALAASVAVHLVLILIGALVIVKTVTEKQVDFLPGGGSKGATEAAQSLQHKVQQKRNTWLKNKQPLKRVVSTSISPNITLPEAAPDLDFPDTSSLLTGKGMSGGGFGSSGMGKGFGSGMGFGGKINFMGNSGVGKYIVFVVDVSASMSALGDSGVGTRISRFELLKRELTRTIGRLPPNTHFQVLFFSDFAWPHNEVDSRNNKAFEKYAWKITPESTSVRIPPFRYINTTSSSVASSIQIINDSDNPGGTNWGSGLFMALKGTPKPDVIFFMTDGNKSDSVGWVSAVTKLNFAGGKRTIIHTTAMMEPDAAEELSLLAKQNGGKFTIVQSTGLIIQGDEYFKP